jgi:hypothetical protein
LTFCLWLFLFFITFCFYFLFDCPMPSPIYGLPELAQNQANAYLTVNYLNQAIEVLTGAKVISRAVTSPPSGSADGDLYIVPVGASGAWTGEENKLAIKLNATWYFFAPSSRIGIKYLESESKLVHWNGTAWVELGLSTDVEFIQDTVAAMLAGGTHTGISFNYDDPTGTISATVSGGSGGGSGGGGAGGELASNLVLLKDSNWRLEFAGSGPRTGNSWNSFASGESGQGKIRLGYYVLGQTLHLMLAGGGSTNGNLKLIKIIEKDTNIVLISTTLATVLGVDVDALTYCTISTSSDAGKTACIEVEDADSGSGWAWISIGQNIFVQ